jgi:uncharacterized iron-regulated protein
MKMRSKKIIIIICAVMVNLLAFGEQEEDETLRLKIGDSILKNLTMPVAPGEILSAQQGKPISFLKMIEEMKQSRFVYIGESHNSLPMHEIQFKIIKALYGQDRNLSIGMEMFPVTAQEGLNKWALGILSKGEFLREAKWYTNWSFNFGFYRMIFEFAKNNNVSVYALNAPREIITKVRMKGWESLSKSEKDIAPEPDLSHSEHRKLIRTIFESADFPHSMKGEGLDMMFEGLYRAQSAWDEAMSFHAHNALIRGQGKLVVLAGSGHLIYNLGINRRVYEKNELPFKTVVIVSVPHKQGKILVSRSLADYVWGIPEEQRPAFPSIGIKFKKIDGITNLIVERDPIDGIAKGADFKKGDVIISVEGKVFSDINELKIYLAQFTWGDEVSFRLLREAQEKDVILKFQYTEKQDK